MNRELVILEGENELEIFDEGDDDVVIEVELGLPGRDGEQGPAGPPGSDVDLPDFTLIFDNQLI